jgi:hypothetical protein
MFATSQPPLETPVRQIVESAIKGRFAILGDPLLDLRTVRAALGNCSYSRLRGLILSGELPSFRLGKRGHYKIRQSALMALIERGDHHNG